MGIKIIVLDCDGVILDSVSVKTEAFVRLVREHGEDATKKMLYYHLNNGGVSRFEKFAWFYRKVLDREITGEESNEMNRRFTDYCLDGVMNAAFVPGALEFITAYHKRIPLYVASGTPQEELRKVFIARDLAGYFKGVYGTPPAKAAILARIIRDARVSPKETLMVGDSSTDLEAAESVGSLFYGCGNGFSASKWSWSKNLNGLKPYIETYGKEATVIK